MPAVEIVAVGTELLLGQLADTNTAFVAGRLAGAGIDVFGTHTVGDNRERIAGLFREVLERADGAVVTGGLGPTVDDLTKEAACDALGVDVELNAEALRIMEALFESLGRPMRDNNRKQALLPKGARVFANAHGTAPGFVAARADGKFIACMPGVPFEMKPMLDEQVLPWLRERFGARAGIYTRVLHTINISESEIDHRIADLFRALENPKIAVLAHGGRCDVKIMAKAADEIEAQKLIDPVEIELAARLQGHVFGYDEDSLAGSVHALLLARAQRVAVAESCTGGLICSALTSVPGASRSFIGGVVAYDNRVKADALNVSADLLEEGGAVSEGVALAMAGGIRKRYGADVAVATTGVAGPDGGSAEKPVGLIWLALSAVGHEEAHRLMYRGSRTSIQTRATTAALGLLWKYLGRREPTLSKST
ncbi:MAG: competence/damage-inducible protein A [Candidatus Eremiobacteraeota bacterium]|nr:competence/damage-inducible protein A [Candidatus Eremiobacteraeota bacterium]